MDKKTAPEPFIYLNPSYCPVTTLLHIKHSSVCAILASESFWAELSVGEGQEDRRVLLSPVYTSISQSSGVTIWLAKHTHLLHQVSAGL